ncbi:Glycosyltransferase, DXD sugar-binding motif protein [Moelleriella libera RCEF 2490]|uniref:Glycosyltransferase, DXD sugar-binding motif protein n=1 Tax=Moelleriella libera RCEF 2490 TaxID=1081109 RepID=A0A168ADX0_9HYPO|nr:Glycosyltransferase, DXD sugar-binding motif protein [Moelleriella libera RCEF 2490]
MGIRSCRLARNASLLLFACCVLVVAVYISLRARGIFLEHAGVTLTQDDVALAYEHAKEGSKTQYIPRIIHQIYHNWHDEDDPDNTTMPAKWKEARESCISLHKEWENILWTTKTSREFIEKKYPKFLKTYDGFRYPVQRVDALRYYLMRYYGGIYIDLDNGCRANLEPLLYYPTWTTDGGHGTLSNNILGAEPGHPFWELVTNSLKSYSWNYLLPYLTISYATGQWFLTDVWQTYHAKIKGKKEPPLTRIMMDMRPGAAPWTFFTATEGGSWNNWDNDVFGWIGSHLVIVVFGGAAALALQVAVFCLTWKVIKAYAGRRARYQRLQAKDVESTD